MRKFVLAAVVLGSLLLAPSASAVIPNVLNGDVNCRVAADGVRECGQVGIDEIQQVTVSGATGGTFTLTFSGQTTAPLAFNSTAAQIDVALEALSNIGAGNVAVTGAGGGPWTVTFTGALGSTNVAEMTANGAGLTGAAPTATVTTLTQGAPAPPARSTSNETFDGVPLDVNVAFPPDPGAGDGNYPLIMWGHGYGGGKLGFGASASTNGLRRFTSRGYAVITITTRGFRESCGTADSKTAEPGTVCEDEGYLRLMDTRYEVRDYQELAAVLANEDVIDPQRIGATGGSYGGGLSMALGALKDRKMLTNDSLVPWNSGAPDNEPMRIAGAAPDIPWTDLSYSLVPNGNNLDYVVDSPYRGRTGVMKQSLVTGLYFSGLATGAGQPNGYYAPAGTDPDADLNSWYPRLSAGEPYDGDALVDDALSEIRTHHASYYIPHAQAPAPMLISNGFTDDLFPGDEAIRFYNRTKVEHPSTPISMFFGDFGHQRSSNRNDVSAARDAAQNTWLDFYVKGTGPTPPQGVTAYTLTCPTSQPSGGPFTSTNWASMPKGEVRIDSPAAQVIQAGAGSDAIATTFNPATSNNPCAATAGADQVGTATYRLPEVTGNGYTLMGSPTVVADIESLTPNSQVAARLLDVAPAGNQTLVARALYRPPTGKSTQVFQLHPNGWHFAAGHVAKLELLPKDAGASATNSYGRASNGQGSVTVSNLDFRFPVLEKPGAVGGAVKVAGDKVVPAGLTLHPDVAAINNDTNASLAGGVLSANDKFITVKVDSPAAWEACHAGIQAVSNPKGLPPLEVSKKKKGKKKNGYVIAKGTGTVAGGTRGVIKLRLTKKGRKLAESGGRKKLVIRLATAEQAGAVIVKRTARFSKGKKKK